MTNLIKAKNKTKFYIVLLAFLAIAYWYFNRSAAVPTTTAVDEFESAGVSESMMEEEQ